MKRPRIALWIQWHAGGWRAVRNESPIRWCPTWLWRWSLRRVDRWHEYQQIQRRYALLQQHDPDAIEGYFGWKP